MKNKISWTILILTLAVFLISSASAINIANCSDLQAMNDNVITNYVLTNNIDCSDTINWNSGNGFVPIGDNANRFTGTFNGQGYNITDLFISRSGTDYQAFIGYAENSEIKNVGLININVTGNIYVGGLVGYNDGTSINSSYVTGNILGTNYWIGGLVGFNTATGTINNTYVMLNVIGASSTGGLVGQSNGLIENSYSIGNVTSTSGNDVGGLVSDMVGGTIANSYSIASVSGNNFVGGLVGYNTGTCTNSYWNSNLSGQSTSACGTELSDVELLNQTFYTDWDFTNIWNIQTNSIPYLRFNPSPYFPFGIEEIIEGNNLSTILTTPLDNSVFSVSTINFNASYTATGYNLTNATLWVWKNGNIFNNSITKIISGTSNSSTFSVSNFILEEYEWNVLTCGENVTESLCRFAETNRTFYVNNITFGLCNSTLNVPYLNFTFRDTNTSNFTNSTISATIYYWYSGMDSISNKTFTLINSSTNPSYAFCFSPADKNASISINMLYSSVGYVQGTYIALLTNLNNVTTNKILNLSLTPIIPPIPPSQFSGTGQTIYDVLNGVGAGLGIFLQILGVALPILVIGLAFVMVIVSIVFVIPHFIKQIYKK